MIERSFQGVATDSFWIEASFGAGTLRIRLKGTGDTAAVAPLESFLEDTSREMTQIGSRNVVFDVRSLYLLNSSCLKALLAFMFRVVATDLNCGIHFIVDPKLSWQRRSLMALVRMAPAQVWIEDG